MSQCFGLAQTANHFEKYLAIWQFCMENGLGPADIFLILLAIASARGKCQTLNLIFGRSSYATCMNIV